MMGRTVRSQAFTLDCLGSSYLCHLAALQVT